MNIKSIFPFMSDLSGYNGRTFKDDFVAAMTVAIVVLPQSIAYALIAGVDPVYGLYASIVPVIFAALFGSSNHLITGPTNAIALMIASTMKNHAGEENAIAMLLLLTFMVGVFQFAFSLLKVGKVVSLVSHSVIVGFTAGAGIIIGLGQLNEFLGIRIPGGYHPLYEKVLLTFSDISSANIYSLGLAVLTVVVVLVSRKISRHIPGALLSLVICAVIVGVYDLGGKGVRLVGEIPGTFPPFQMVNFNLSWIFSLFGGAFAIAIVGLVEAISIAKSIAINTDQKIDANREFMGQGMANMAGAFFGSIASSGSFTRSAINHSAGAQTRMAAVMSGLLVAVAVVFFAPYARYIPGASLAAVIIIVAFQMINKHAIRKIYQAGRHDMTVMLVTIGATIVMPDLERAILTGITVSIIVHIWNTGETKVTMLEDAGDGSFRETDMSAKALKPHDIAMIHIEGNLYFGSTLDLEDKLRQVSENVGSKILILRLKRVNVVDISAFEIVEVFIEKALEKGNIVLLCGVSPTLKRFIDRVGLTKKVGEDRVFMMEDKIYASTRKAYAKAQELIRSC